LQLSGLTEEEEKKGKGEKGLGEGKGRGKNGPRPTVLLHHTRREWRVRKGRLLEKKKKREG